VCFFFLDLIFINLEANQQKDKNQMINIKI